MNEVATLALPRPKGLPATCTDETLLLGVRGYLLGERWQALLALLDVDTPTFAAMIATPQWHALQTAFRDEFVNRVKGKLTRMESKILDDLDDALHNQVTAYNMMGDAYQRDLSVSEKLKIWQVLQDSQRTMVKLEALKTPTPRDFDRKARMEELAKFAKASTIEGETVKESA